MHPDDDKRGAPTRDLSRKGQRNRHRRIYQPDRVSGDKDKIPSFKTWLRDEMRK